MSELPHLLIVDGSKVVRASLAKNLRGHFSIREEKCGESAWQALILDPQIIAVIAGATLARLDSAALLEKIRSSRLCRIRVLPFCLIESDAMDAAARQRALACGASGFLPKGLGGLQTARQVKQLLAQWRWNHPLACIAVCGATEHCAPALYAEAREDSYWQDHLGISGVFAPATGPSAIPDGRLEAPAKPLAPQEGPGTAVLLARLGAVLAQAQAGGRRGVGVLSFALDRHAGLLEQFGPGLVGRIEAKFEQLLDSRLMKSDCIAKLAADRIVVVAAETTFARCMNLAERVVKGVTAAQVSVGGRRLKITVSVGIACLPYDAAEAATDEALLELAGERLEAAMRAGGNRVLGPRSSGRGPEGWGGAELPQLGGWLHTASPEVLLPQLGRLGLLVLPVLRELDRSYGLGLPLAEIERRLQERAAADTTGPGAGTKLAAQPTVGAPA